MNGLNRRAFRVGSLLVLALPACGLVGCNDDEAQRAFRDAAASELETGLTGLASGIISGAFAVFELGAQDPGGETTTP